MTIKWTFSYNFFVKCSYITGVTYIMAHSEMPTIPIFKADIRVMILKVKITANNDFRKVPNKITGVIPTSIPVIPDHR